MKNFCITFLLLFIIILTAGCSQTVNGISPKEETEFLRIHVRANSNSDEDQNIKYIIKDEIVEYLTPFIAQCHSKDETAQVITQKKKTLEYLIDEILRQNGLKYSSRISLKNEKFPTRVYDGFTLESGYYDAVIVELGEAKGDNWWCVVYPPLCFTDGKNVKYSSLILQIIEEFRERYFKANR
ncbi:MAG: stage II sporulation protein R [Clostridia bacterium]|nr:stage II sporulation protein R [Clostridia bacterium]